MIVGSLLLILVAVVLLGLGLARGSDPMLVGSITASLLAAIALIVGARRPALFNGLAAEGADHDRTGGAAESGVDTRARSGALYGPGAASRTTEPETVPSGAERYGDGTRSGPVPHGSPLTGHDTRGYGIPGPDEAKAAPASPAPAGGIPVSPAPVTVGTAGEPVDRLPGPGTATAADPADSVTGPERADAPDRVTGPERTGVPEQAGASQQPDGPADHPGASRQPGVPEQAPAGVAAEDWADEEDPPDEPPALHVSAVDRDRAAALDADVLVVDGRPRYHLAQCPHLAGREAEPLPIGEAIALGFTPCGLCAPDRHLLAQPRGS